MWNFRAACFQFVLIPNGLQNPLFTVLQKKRTNGESDPGGWVHSKSKCNEFHEQIHRDSRSFAVEKLE
jgi:hypothetical protein